MADRGEIPVGNSVIVPWRCSGRCGYLCPTGGCCGPSEGEPPVLPSPRGGSPGVPQPSDGIQIWQSSLIMITDICRTRGLHYSCVFPHCYALLCHPPAVFIVMPSHIGRPKPKQRYEPLLCFDSLRYFEMGPKHMSNISMNIDDHFYLAWIHQSFSINALEKHVNKITLPCNIYDAYTISWIGWVLTALQ